jgi:hypothetical protein
VAVVVKEEGRETERGFVHSTPQRRSSSSAFLFPLFLTRDYSFRSIHPITMVIKSSKNGGGGGITSSSASSGVSQEEESCYVDNTGRNSSYRSLNRTSKRRHSVPSPPPSKTTSASGNTNSSKTSNKTGKKVSFHTVSIYKVLSRNDYTETEKTATWFTGQEFLHIRNSALDLAKAMDSMMGLHKTKMLQEQGRGLERILKHNLKKHSARRKALFHEIAILQRHGGFRNITVTTPDDLAMLFQSYTHISSLEARAMGRDDEIRARDCYSDDDEFMKVFFRLFGGNALLCSSPWSCSTSGSSTLPSAMRTTNKSNSSSSKDNSNNSKGEASKIASKKTKGMASSPSSNQIAAKNNNNNNNSGGGGAASGSSKSLDVKRKFRDEISSRLVAARSIR